MANVIQLTGGGLTSISLNAGSYMVMSYTIGAPNEEAGHCTDSLELMVTGASSAAVQANVRAIEAYLDAAKTRQRTQAGARVYLTVQWDGSSDAWRAEIRDAELDAAETAGQLWRKAARVVLAVTRGPFEGDWVQLTLTNSNGTNDTAGLTVWNHNDSGTGHDNYALIDSTEVTGSLPAPVKVEMVNATGGTLPGARWFVAANSFSTPTALLPVVEGEDYDAGGSGSNTVSATSSGGYYRAANAGTTGFLQWDVTAAQMQAAGGYPFRIIGRIEAAGVYFKPAIYDTTGLIALGEGDEVYINNTGLFYEDLGVIHIPPGDAATLFGDLRLHLGWRADTSKAVNVDFVHMTPAYACRELVQLMPNIASGAAVVIDESEERAWFTYGATQVPYFVMRGRPVMLWPGRAAALYFFWNRQTASTIADTITVKAYFRPRRWAV